MEKERKKEQVLKTFLVVILSLNKQYTKMCMSMNYTNELSYSLGTFAFVVVFFLYFYSFRLLLIFMFCAHIHRMNR